MLSTKERIQWQLDNKVQHLKPSATLLINERSQKLIKQGKKVYKLGFGQSPFPVPEEVVLELQQHAAIKDYLPVKGLPALRQAVAKHLSIQNNCAFEAEQIIIGPGSKELIYNAQLALNAQLLLPNPSWVSYAPQAQLVGRETIWLDTHQSDNWCLSPETLSNACDINPTQAKILILNYPNNPTGTSYSKKQLKALAEVARNKQLLIIADEIYGLCHHEGQHSSIAEFYPEGTIISTGLSKWCGAGGWRLGVFGIPKPFSWLLDAMATIASETFTSVSAPIQYAAVKAYEGSPNINTYLQNSRVILKSVATFVQEALTKMVVQAPPADGGFYLFPNFEAYREKLQARGILNNTQLCETLLEETGVALLPGIAFGRPAHEFTARLSFVDFDGAKALTAISEGHCTPSDSSFISEYCPNIMNAMNALNHWLNQL